jgi:hypothetical protein
MTGVDHQSRGQGGSPPAHGGLDPAVAAEGDEPAGQALSRLRQAGAALVVTLDAHGRPRTVVPEKTLAAASAGQRVASCQPAWPAATFLQPASAEEARQLAAHNQSQPFLGHRTVVIENGQIVGVVPVPALITRPGRTSRVLERLMWATGSLIMRMRYRHISRSSQPRPRQPPASSP